MDGCKVSTPTSTTCGCTTIWLTALKPNELGHIMRHLQSWLSCASLSLAVNVGLEIILPPYILIHSLYHPLYPHKATRPPRLISYRKARSALLLSLRLAQAFIYPFTSIDGPGSSSDLVDDDITRSNFSTRTKFLQHWTDCAEFSRPEQECRSRRWRGTSRQTGKRRSLSVRIELLGLLACCASGSETVGSFKRLSHQLLVISVCDERYVCIVFSICWSFDSPFICSFPGDPGSLTRRILRTKDCVGGGSSRSCETQGWSEQGVCG